MALCGPGSAKTALTEGIEQAVYNSLNQQTGEDLAHDADGNLVRGVTLSGHAFTADYDGENRLTAIRYTGPDGVIHETAFTYAYTGFLAGVKTFADHAPVSETRILRSGFLPLQDRDRDNQILRQYTWGLNRLPF